MDSLLGLSACRWYLRGDSNRLIFTSPLPLFEHIDVARDYVSSTGVVNTYD
jgi:hypothetical protein